MNSAPQAVVELPADVTSIADLPHAPRRRRWIELLAPLALALAALGPGRSDAAQSGPIQYQFSRISVTNSAGDSANKINNRGEITGTVDGTDGISRGYLFADGKERERGGSAGSVFTEWEGSNAFGDLAGYYADPADPKGNTYKAFIRRADGTVQPIGWPGDTAFNFTVDINTQGQVAGGSSTQGWVRNPDDTYVVFKTPGYQTSGAWGLNDAGIAVGVAFTGFFDVANGLIYDTKTDTAQIWNYPGAAETTLYGINNRGDIVGGFRQTVANAEVPFVRWADGSTQVLTFPEESKIRVYGINDARVVVGRYTDTNKVSHSFLASPVVPLRRYTVTRIDVPGAVHTTPNAINDSGTVAGEWYNADYSVNKGFARTADGVFTVIEPAGGYGGMTVQGLNSQGDISGWMEGDGYLRRGTNFTILQAPGAGTTYGRDLNDAGVVVGDATGASGNFNWKYDGTNITVLEIARASQSGFTSINNSGDILGYSVRTIVGNGVTNQVNSNWLLRGTNFTVITYPNATLCSLLNISETGTILGLFRQASSGSRNRYFLYQEGEFTELQFAGDPAWDRYAATDLNSSGDVVGNFRTADGVYHGFVATATTRVSNGDTDIGVAFEDGAFDLHVHHEATDTEYAPDAALLHVAAVAQTTVPANPAFGFLGAPGAPVWILPQAENPKLLFLGLAAEEITNGVFVGNQVSLALKSVEGPGSVAVYTVDGFGSPQVRWNSADGLSDQDTFTLQTGGHQHVNWAFSKPGSYRVGLQASGTLAAGNKPVTSSVEIYHFEVISPAVQLTVTRHDASTLKLTVTTEDGIVYQLQSATNAEGPWNNVGQAFLGTGREKEFSVPVAGGAAFYRISKGVGN